MKTPLYRQALKHSWGLAWKHKWLWPLGLFATFLGQMGILELLTTVGIVDNGATPSQYMFEIIADLQGFSYGFLSALPMIDIVGITWVLVIFVGIAVFLAFVATVSQGALIHVASRSVKSKSKLPDVGKSWHAGVSHFWRLFFIQVFKKLVLLAMAVVVGYFTVQLALHSGTFEVFSFLAVFTSAIIVGLVVSFFVIYSACYVVVDEKSNWEAMEDAWHLFTHHWFVSIEIGVILLAINMLLGLFVALVAFVFFIPSLIMWIIAAVLGSSTLFATATTVAFLLLSMFIMFVGSVYSVFSTSAWTYLFMKMHKKKVKSRTLHWLGG